MSTLTTKRRKVVAVHSGARDAYQVARALEEAGRLEALVTDLFWPPEAKAATLAASLIPSNLRRQLLARSAPEIPSRRVKPLSTAGLLSLLLEKWKQAPFAWKRSVARWTDGTAREGRRAACHQKRGGAAQL